MVPSTIFLLLFLISHLPIHTAANRTKSELDPSRCLHFNCGNLSDLRYPFWSDALPDYCGHPAFKLDCTNPLSATLNISALPYLVLHIDPDDPILTIARIDLVNEENICSSNQTLVNTNLNDLPPPLFSLTSADEKAALFYNCDDETETTQFPNDYTCLIGSSPREVFLESTTMRLRNGLASGCRSNVSVPVLVRAADDLMKRRSGDVRTVFDVLRRGFQVRWDAGMVAVCKKCTASGGVCGYKSTTTSSAVDGSFVCLCSDSNSDQVYAHSTSCGVPMGTSPPGTSLLGPSSGKTGKNSKTKAIIGVVLGAAGALLLTFLVWIIYQQRKKRKYAPSSYVSRSISSYPSSRSDVEKGSRYMGVHVFTYTELVDATNNFDEKKELGDGGFGTVYYGKLKDGREVAVKRLYENNYRRVEQFMNEVDILTRLHHKNLVILYGCTSRHSRELLLVYEYIENGTVADHLHGVKARPGSLPWPLRLNIAVETARALTYLHASDIIHRDVKTNNILMDKNFCVKVADFGLSRLFPMDVTHVSTAPQGTPGYVDPEYHQCYQLTDKSDVYSFGVVLAELISSLPAVDITRHRHEINLSNMAINKIQSQSLHEFVDQSLGFGSDETVRKSISAVAELAFQCLQSAKELRPTMDEVLETLTMLQTGKRDPDQSPDKDTTSDDVGLLKYGVASPLSPVSVTAKWSSSSGTTTPNTSC